MIMNFYEVIYNRKTVRNFLGKPVDLEIIKRILEAGNAAPTWNHTRDWSYIILRMEEEKAYALVGPKATPGYAGGRRIAYSEEKSRQRKNSSLK